MTEDYSYRSDTKTRKLYCAVPVHTLNLTNNNSLKWYLIYYFHDQQNKCGQPQVLFISAFCISIIHINVDCLKIYCCKKIKFKQKPKYFTRNLKVVSTITKIGDDLTGIVNNQDFLKFLQ